MQVTSISFTSRFFSPLSIESQYFALSFSPTYISRTSLIPSILIPIAMYTVFFFYILAERCFVLLYKPQFKLAVSVARYCNFYLSGAGFHCFSAVSVSAVFGILVAVVISAVAKLIVELCFKSVFKNLSHHLLEYRPQVAHVLYFKQ